MSARTPGPWETSVNDEGQWDVCAEGGGDMVADLSDCPENAEGNARLIAAAPDLLAALKGLRAAALSEYVSCDCPNASICRPSIKAADAAIAKAEGKP